MKLGLRDRVKLVVLAYEHGLTGRAGAEHGQFIPSDDRATFISRGAIDAFGTAVEVSGSNNGGTDIVQLPGGSFTLTLVNSTSGGGGSSNPVTCVVTFYGPGTSTISDGTGRFAGIEGTGTYTYDGTFFGTPTAQGCSPQGTVVDLVQDQGAVTLP